MKKISQSILIVLFISIILPNLAFASWWNPSTWFQKPEAQVVDKVVETPIEKIVEKPIEKTFTKTVTVDNPDQAKQIKDLSEQVEVFQKSVSDKDAEITDLKTKLDNSSAYGKLVFKRYNEAKSAFDELYTTSNNILDSYKACIYKYAGASTPVVQNISVQLNSAPAPLTKDQYCQKYYFPNPQYNTTDQEYCTGVKPVQR